MNYEILGESLPVVVCHLDSGESVINESGSMVWMSPNMKMETIGGGVGKVIGRMFSGEKLFQNRYTAEQGAGLIAFASSFPGTILAVEVTPQKPVILQKSAFLAATSGVELSVFFNKKFSSGLFGGEGFIMQQVSGYGTVFVEIDGHAVTYDLGAGQSMIVDTGNLAMMDATCSMEIKTVPGVKNMLFGGEGVFNTQVTGPGKVTFQSMPISGVAAVLKPYFPPSSN
ncbi:MAG: TIGR00266 family protein [Eubacteriales bacterium]